LETIITVTAPSSVGVAAPDSRPATRITGASSAGSARQKDRPTAPAEARGVTGATIRPVTAMA